MTDLQSFLDELNGRLTAVTVRYPEAALYIESLQKHVRYGLHHPDDVNVDKFLKKVRQWLSVQIWKHPTFRDDFVKMISLLDDFKKKHGG